MNRCRPLVKAFALTDISLINNKYRDILYTVPNDFQLVVMSLEPEEDIPSEVHPTTTQFVYLISGEAEIITSDGTFYLTDYATDAIVIPPNTRHYIKNISSISTLKLVIIYTNQLH